MSTETQDNTKKNTQAIASLILGVISIIFALFSFSPGLLGNLGCVGGAAALLALFSGVKGLRVARELGERGRKLAITGMASAVIGAILAILPFFYGSTQTDKIIDQVVADATHTALLTSEAPPLFEGEGFALRYHPDWKTIDISQDEFCQEPGVDCLLFIEHPSGDGTKIDLKRFALEGKAAVEELDEELWNNLVSVGPELQFETESRSLIEIDGLPAVKRIFSLKGGEGERAYLIRINVIKDLFLYQITGGAPNMELFKHHQAEIGEIVTSIQFIP